MNLDQAPYDRLIHRIDTFLYQFNDSGDMNLWSGQVYPNNTYPCEFARQAAILMSASQYMLKVLVRTRDTLVVALDQDSRNIGLIDIIADLDKAISLATKKA
jgi:hypothetical protein